MKIKNVNKMEIVWYYVEIENSKFRYRRSKDGLWEVSTSMGVWATFHKWQELEQLFQEYIKNAEHK
jgi:hypothetical protein